MRSISSLITFGSSASTSEASSTVSSSDSSSLTYNINLCSNYLHNNSYFDVHLKCNLVSVKVISNIGSVKVLKFSTDFFKRQGLKLSTPFIG